MLLYLPVPQPSHFPKPHREHRNSKEGMRIHMDSHKTKSQFTALISSQHIQSAICDYKPLCYWNELTEAQAKMPKNPTFCTRFWTASLAREAKSCKEEKEALTRQNAKWTYLKMSVDFNILHALGFPNQQLGEFLKQKGQSEILGLEGREKFTMLSVKIWPPACTEFCFSKLCKWQ